VNPSAGLSQGRGDLRASLLIGLVCLLVYNANLRLISAGDTYPARFLPFGIWRYGTLTLDPITGTTAQGHPRPYWIAHTRTGHAVSLYPVVLPVLVTPLYAPAVAYLQIRGWDEDQLDRVAQIMEKLIASLLASSGAALMYLLLRRRARPRDALLLTVAFAFGTTTWVISSQALWQHGLAELLVVSTLLILTVPCTPSRALAAGFLCALLAANRPPDALLAAALGLYSLLWAGRRSAVLLVAGAAVPVAFVLIYNLGITGALAGGYGVATVADPTFFQRALLPGVAGLLFSPARGLFVFCPFLLFLPVFFPRAFQDPGTRPLGLLLIAAVVAQVLLYAKTDWRAGFSWGPRFLTDLIPILVWMLVPILTALRPPGRLVFVAAVGLSAIIQGIGAIWYTGTSDLAIFAVRSGPGEMRAAWDPRNTPFLAELRHGPAPRGLGRRLKATRTQAAADVPALPPKVRGNLDRIAASKTPVVTVAAGADVLLEGWALDGYSTPAAVLVTVDGRPSAMAEVFFDRSDVRVRLQVESPAGWRVLIPSKDLHPGEHEILASVRSRQSDSLYPLPSRKLIVLPGPAR
jgi:hypothetical protein